MLKSPKMNVVSMFFERKTANSFRKSAYGPGGLCTVAKARNTVAGIFSYI